jgi:hypothetical protein
VKPLSQEQQLNWGCYDTHMHSQDSYYNSEHFMPPTKACTNPQLTCRTQQDESADVVRPASPRALRAVDQQQQAAKAVAHHTQVVGPRLNAPAAAAHRRIVRWVHMSCCCWPSFACSSRTEGLAAAAFHAWLLRSALRDGLHIRPWLLLLLLFLQ